ncbi:hypothetical protein C8Q77DRAFT_1159864 [Trametes polyzona]|nr:hypothetical protein C8Q77DRAFT_1159864 [Trametes polyzona]
MSAHAAPNPRSGRPNAPMHTVGQGGNPRTMILGMAGVAVGLYAFWRLQFYKQNRSHTSHNPGEMPTWQFRHAQQVPEFNERVSSPGGTGTNLRPRGSSAQEPSGASYVHATPVQETGSGGGAASSGMVGVGSRDGSRRGLESGGANERGGESHGAAVDPRGKDNHAPTSGEETHPVRNVVSMVMTSLHGNGREKNQNSDGHVGQPAATTRKNDRGGIYTKNSDYKDGYRRD